MLSDLFVKLLEDKSFFLKSDKGTDFESRIAKALIDLGYSEILKADFSKDRFGLIKEWARGKDREDYLAVEEREKKQFVKQPFGSQQYPDFLIFSNKSIIPIETKYSTEGSSKPVWNSNLPRPNGFYVFGSYGRQDITFFCGADVLSKEQLIKMHEVFDTKARDMQHAFNNELYQGGTDKHKRGFTIYVRKAFEQKAIGDAMPNYFKHPDREEVEQKTIERIKKLEA